MLQAQRDTIFEYPISQGCCPNGITNGPDGALWFTAGYLVGRITTSGALSYYPVSFTPQGAIALGPDEALWFTGSDGSVGSIGRITPNGNLAQYPTPTMNSFPQAITAGQMVPCGSRRVALTISDGSQHLAWSRNPRSPPPTVIRSASRQGTTVRCGLPRALATKSAASRLPE